jgi:hypothetical protein
MRFHDFTPVSASFFKAHNKQYFSTESGNFSITPGIRNGVRLEIPISGHRQQNMLQSEA